ncbi:MAG: diguanylate cyclase [Anaerolineaceae bacterium]|nr:MAG: diguanylate cyclase [Anaerolineaceae bacterium]
MNLTYAVWLTVSSGVGVFVAYLAWQRRQTAPAAPALFMLMLSLAFWSLTYAISWIVPSDAMGIFWLKLTYVGAVSAPVAFFVLVLYFVDRYAWLTDRVYVLLMFVPILTIFLLWTDPWHHLFFGDYPLLGRGSIYHGGPWFYVSLVYLYALIIAGSVLLIRTHLRSSQFYQRQTRVVLAGALLPWLVNFLMLLGWNPARGLDLTPLAFTGTGLLFAYGIWGYRMMDLIPVSRDVLVENMDDAILVVDTKWRVVDINPKALELADSGLDTPIGRPLVEVFSRWRHIYPNFSDTDGRVEVKLDRPPFSNLDLQIASLKDRQGHMVGRLVTWRDISAQKQTEAKLRVFFHAVEQNPTAIVITDPQGRIEYVNPRLTQLTGYGLDALRGKTPRVFKSGETADDLYARLWETVTKGDVWEGEVLNCKKNGQVYWVHELIAPVMNDAGMVTHFVAMQEDITERRNSEAEMKNLNIRLQGKLTEIENLHDQLREEAIRDGLTRMFNRRYMEETLEREISRVEREPQPISVVMMDVDLFKSINDNYGHQAGDAVLQTLGTMLLENTRISDIACRYGGDEMLVVMPGATQEVAVARAEEWRAAFSMMEFTFGEAKIRTTLSLGVASFPEQAQNLIQLLTAADKALYWAKIKRNQVQLYDPSTMGGSQFRSDSIR